MPHRLPCKYTGIDPETALLTRRVSRCWAIAISWPSLTLTSSRSLTSCSALCPTSSETPRSVSCRPAGPSPTLRSPTLPRYDPLPPPPSPPKTQTHSPVSSNMTFSCIPPSEQTPAHDCYLTLCSSSSKPDHLAASYRPRSSPSTTTASASSGCTSVPAASSTLMAPPASGAASVLSQSVAGTLAPRCAIIRFTSPHVCAKCMLNYGNCARHVWKEAIFGHS